MAERSVYLEGANLGLACAMALVICGAVVAAVPARSHLDRVEAAIVDASSGLDAWQADPSRFQPVLPEDHARWNAGWLALEARLHPVRGDAELMALVAEGIQAEGARGFHVARKASEAEEGAAGESSEFALAPIGSGEPLFARPERVQASMTASYDATVRILERLESHELPARLDEIELQRDYPDVSMHLELVYFVRTESMDE